MCNHCNQVIQTCGKSGEFLGHSYPQFEQFLLTINSLLKTHNITPHLGNFQKSMQSGTSVFKTNLSSGIPLFNGAFTPVK
jgi:hypothetical protein